MHSKGEPGDREHSVSGGSRMSARIVALPGDGIGPEVTGAADEVLGNLEVAEAIEDGEGGGDHLGADAVAGEGDDAGAHAGPA